MRKIAAIFFLGISLLVFTQLGQLLKLPVLVHHFLEHHHENEGISFVEFLHKHYAAHHSHPSTNHEHENLPFKSHEGGFAQSTITLQVVPAFDFKTVYTLTSRKNIVLSEGFYSSATLARIWQPPRCQQIT